MYRAICIGLRISGRLECIGTPYKRYYTHIRPVIAYRKERKIS